MISVCIAYFYAIYVHYEHRSGQSKKECSYPVPSIFDIIICGFTPSVRMFIGQGLSLEARRAAQAERRSANTATASASVAAAAAAASTTAAAAGRTSGLRQRLRHYLLSPQLPKWIPLPLYQPARPQMVLRPLLVLPVVSPVVWCLLSMLRIFAASTIVRCVP